MKSYKEYPNFNLYIGRLLNSNQLQVIDQKNIRIIPVNSNIHSGDILYFTDKNHNKIAEFSLNDQKPISFHIENYQFFILSNPSTYRFLQTLNGYQIFFSFEEEKYELNIKNYNFKFYQIFENIQRISNEHIYQVQQIL